MLTDGTIGDTPFAGGQRPGHRMAGDVMLDRLVRQHTQVSSERGRLGR